MGMTSERWRRFSKREQLLFIGSEFERARVSGTEGNREYLQGALLRALEFIDITLNDPQWREERYRLWVLRDAVAEYLAGKDTADVENLYHVL